MRLAAAELSEVSKGPVDMTAAGQPDEVGVKVTIQPDEVGVKVTIQPEEVGVKVTIQPEEVTVETGNEILTTPPVAPLATPPAAPLATPPVTMVCALCVQSFQNCPFTF